MGFGYEVSALLGGFTCLSKELVGGRGHCLLFSHVRSQHWSSACQSASHVMVQCMDPFQMEPTWILNFPVFRISRIECTDPEQYGLRHINYLIIRCSYIFYLLNSSCLPFSPGKQAPRCVCSSLLYLKHCPTPNRLAIYLSSEQSYLTLSRSLRDGYYSLLLLLLNCEKGKGYKSICFPRVPQSAAAVQSRRASEAMLFWHIYFHAILHHIRQLPLASAL